jgi:hypothetical protein
MSLSYSQLVTAIQNYTENDETTFVANIPNFVRNTETLINNSVQLPVFRKNVVGETTSESPYLALPTDFLSLFSIAIAEYNPSTTYGPPILGPYNYLLQKDVNYIREAFPYPESVGLPTHYAIFSNASLLLGPTPNDVYPVEMHYYALPASIVDAGVSWVGTNFPNVLLWGALTEAYIYMKGEPDLIQTYQGKFQEALGRLKELGDGKDRQDNYRTMQVRQGVE